MGFYESLRDRCIHEPIAFDGYPWVTAKTLKHGFGDDASYIEIRFRDMSIGELYPRGRVAFRGACVVGDEVNWVRSSFGLPVPVEIQKPDGSLDFAIQVSVDNENRYLSLRAAEGVCMPKNLQITEERFFLLLHLPSVFRSENESLLHSKPTYLIDNQEGTAMVEPGSHEAAQRTSPSF